MRNGVNGHLKYLQNISNEHTVGRGISGMNFIYYYTFAGLLCTARRPIERRTLMMHKVIRGRTKCAYTTVAYFSIYILIWCMPHVAHTYTLVTIPCAAGEQCKVPDFTLRS